ncbi:MAG: hypothetical protein R6V23_11630 [Bacteroidales bacterium]
MNKPTNILFAILLLGMLPVANLYSQAKTDFGDDIFSKIQSEENTEGEVVIFQDLRINNLVHNHIEKNKRKAGVPGYRIRIFNDLGSGAREHSQEVQADFYDKFPEIPVYREYDSPYFKVYVGDFRTKIDAMKEFKRIKQYFPAAFMVPDEINYPSLEE